MTDQRLSTDIARVIRGILAERKIHLNEFADQMGEPKSSVYRWINDGGTFKTDKLDDMAEALGMTTLELVERALRARREAEASGADPFEGRPFPTDYDLAASTDDAPKDSE